MKPKVLVTRNIPRDGLPELFQKCHVDYHDSNELMSEDELLKRAEEADGILCVGMKVSEELMEHSPKLKVISNYGVGYDNIDVEAATRRKIIVTNTPDVVTEATAELTFGIILAVTRRIAEADRILKSKAPFRWGPMQLLGFELTGKTLGIIGFGRIGQAVARRAKAFGMNVIYYQRNPRDKSKDQSEQCYYQPLDELLKRSDIVSIHVPKTDETFHLIGQEQFAIMKRGAYLINTARGPVVDEEALVRALKSGILAGAGLDVFEREPYIHPELLKLDNTVLTPHIGTSTLETRIAMAKMAAQNLIAVFEGKQPPNVVNPEVYQ
ncbi:D-glycerate dehydrogenase [Tepidanaerobacter sp. GT38]|uniref:2-hydroxyacid dehydrogenase n=1 Tax=Tepidanaerobacter sp. GT38 TaxID=2722793 RepID=UPI001F233884|nr:D-glycerate dehydrogenase [Tepidanaerobacter sp. GT38]